MTTLLESPLAVAAIGLVLVTMAAIVYSQSRSNGSVIALAAAVLLTVGGVLGERLYLTPREQVVATIGELFNAVEAGDLPGVLALIDAGATDMRADAESLMPRFRVETASEGGEVRVELPADPTAPGAVATARLKPLIKAVHTKTGATAAYFDGLELDLTRTADGWVLIDYRPAKDWRSAADRM